MSAPARTFPTRRTRRQRLMGLVLLAASALATTGAVALPSAARFGTPAPKEASTVALDATAPTDDAAEIADRVAALPVVPARTHWDDLADCESGTRGPDGIPNEGTADWASTVGYFEGGLQFAPPTWDAFRDPGMPERGDLATREQQIAVAERVLDAQGWGAWPACSRIVGLR